MDSQGPRAGGDFVMLPGPEGVRARHIGRI